jgi:hypothetical protein
MGDPDGIGHIRITERDKGDHVDGANPRMGSRMLAHIDHIKSLPANGEAGIFDDVGGADERQDAPVMIRIHAEVQKLDPLDSSGGVHEGLPLSPVSALAEIGHAFNDFHF